ncbi:MAG: beta-tubulin [Enterovirga sp.]|nr:beta-tubulin [Enterovirga sp.]
MRDIPAALAAHLAEAATTLCRCWRLTRRDGAVSGFTDHDRDLLFDGCSFAAGTGLEAAEATAELGFAVSGGDVSGALVSAGLTEADIAAGLYDDASVETWIVNWAAPAERLLLDLSSIGEIRRADGAFVAELRGPMHRLDEERGLTYRAACSATLGDERCRVDLDDPAFSGFAAVATTDGGLALTTTGLGAFADGWFYGGQLLWTGGANAGRAVEIKAHRAGTGAAELDLWQRMPATIAAGDPFRVTAGCDKRLATCRDKFGNVPNHRGFPHMPGSDFVLRVAASGTGVFDGGSLFR